ncbi:hypothetical protein E4U30_006035 [Claviceps sp. LM220 group G6]|nr:hypothetical protein E4U30_006035 [Claviceps sp. LM220 group G6]
MSLYLSVHNLYFFSPKTALDHYYNDFKQKREIARIKQSRLHAVRRWIATNVDPNDEEDEVSFRNIVVYLRDELAPNATNVRTGILKKYNQHRKEAKRANTNFET